jgi:hypothetical protein
MSFLIYELFMLALQLVFILALLSTKIIGPMDIANNIVAPIIVATVTGVATWAYTRISAQRDAAVDAQRQLKRKIDAAPRTYINHLDALITRAYREGVGNAIVNARAIVAARNSMRGSLSNIRKNLNTEIDRLASEVGMPFEETEHALRTATSDTPDAATVFQTIDVLSRMWPAKRAEIEVEIRKILAEFGLPIDATNIE